MKPKKNIKTISIIGTLFTALLFISISMKAYQCSSSKDKIPFDSIRWKAHEKEKNIDSILHTFVHSKPDTIARYHQLYYVFDTLCYSGRPLRILHLGDSHVAGNSFPEAIDKYLSDLFGKARSANEGIGISYSYIAKNGATALNFLTPERIETIGTKNPDLVIMSFGTNECHGMGYDELQHLADLSKAVDKVHELCPMALIMLTTPPGDCLTQRTKYYTTSKTTGKRYRHYRYKRKPNPMTVKCAALLCMFAEDQELPIWDLNTIAGGDMAVRNWQKKNMMRKDGVHFYPEGYQFQAKMFGEAFSEAFNHYLEDNDMKKKDLEKQDDKQTDNNETEIIFEEPHHVEL